MTIRHLLTHTAGAARGRRRNRATAVAGAAALIRTPLAARAGRADGLLRRGLRGPVAAAAERAAGEPLHRPAGAPRLRAAGDERHALPARRRGVRPLLALVPQGRRARRYAARCTIPRPASWAACAGNAGLFSTAADLARFAAMMASGGALDGVRVLRRGDHPPVHRARSPTRRTAPWGGRRRKQSGGSAGRQVSRKAFGHTGFTGTSLWVDPDSGHVDGAADQPHVRSARQQPHPGPAPRRERPRGRGRGAGGRGRGVLAD